ncbi:nuclear envelope integral membrane protein 1 isoform X1 [Dunckerocampus dactyliophorus]|uniref:nuclear envelope integral membrane protein 1 isoform X1 n=1 Tax=Dunckerocampus dactyliophorus TaxID=161453 RepID=UPI0024069FB5|nr:nuclear envelope integral membrane protein 1 isoform X1 [Dunckerocampus dactyliophorus]
MAGYMKERKRVMCTRAESIFFTVLLFCLPQTSSQTTGNKPTIIDLRDGESYAIAGTNLFCYTNTIVPNWRQTWTRIQVRVWSLKMFKVETVRGEEELQELERFTLWSWVQGLLREGHNETTININLFSNKTCFKIEPTDETNYTVKSLRKFDIYLFIVFLAGVMLFAFADSLSRSQIFFYSAGMGTGMIASLIIVFFLLARLLPRRSPFYLFIVGGWSFSVYTIQLVCRNLNLILQEHWHAALGYVGVVGFISFAVCYRYGPLVDEKSVNILSWTLQLFGLLFIYLGIQIQQVAFAIIVAALLAKNLEYPIVMAVVVARKIRHYIHWKPEKRRLLTEEEYRKQGEEETLRSLEELRKYCNSPEFSPWKAVSRLQSPKRFADFIEGSSHLMANEVSVHAQEYGCRDFWENDFFDTDDDDEDPSSLCQNQGGATRMP